MQENPSRNLEEERRRSAGKLLQLKICLYTGTAQALPNVPEILLTVAEEDSFRLWLHRKDVVEADYYLKLIQIE